MRDCIIFFVAQNPREDKEDFPAKPCREHLSRESQDSTCLGCWDTRGQVFESGFLVTPVKNKVVPL